MKEHNKSMIVDFRASDMFILESFKQRFYKIMREKMQPKQLCFCYKVFTVFGKHFEDRCKLIFSRIERFFTEIVESTSFVELDYELVKRILSSQQLFLTSELEVLNAADTWVKHDIKARSMNALELLQTVRLPLLSVNVLQSVLSGSSFFCEDADSVSFIKEILDKKKLKDTFSSNVEHRYCAHEKFSLLVFTKDESSNYTMSRNADGKKEFTITALPPLESNNRYWYSGVYIRGEVYVLGGQTDDYAAVMAVEKYSPLTKKWSRVTTMYNERFDFDICAFMNEIFLVGGTTDGRVPIKDPSTFLLPSLVFNPANCTWKEVACLNTPRGSCSCCVFEGKIVASGGMINFDCTLTVESYDHTSDTWTFMPNMLGERNGHTSTAIRNKLFLIGGNWEKCEVFDSHSNRFTYLKSPAKLFDSKDCEIATASIANKIVFISHESILEDYFDVEKNEWVEHSGCELDYEAMELSCVKVPQL